MYPVRLDVEWHCTIAVIQLYWCTPIEQLLDNAYSSIIIWAVDTTSQNYPLYNRTLGHFFYISVFFSVHLDIVCGVVFLMRELLLLLMQETWVSLQRDLVKRDHRMTLHCGRPPSLENHLGTPLGERWESTHREHMHRWTCLKMPPQLAA